ncbi:branched-chain amino acid ABC transporter permease [Halobacteriales archaeon QS_8_69_26]|nr:MAG: branched-chain amino acid ABC transporter permease [Halobacteriales archaeon QS_8_69_26]
MSAFTAVIDQLINGLTIGIVYVLLAAGLSIIFGVMDVINFAHGELFALGAYFALAVAGVQLLEGLPFHAFWISLLLAPLAVAVVGGGIERLTIRPLYGRNPLYHILLTFGLVLVFKDVIETRCCPPYFLLFRGTSRSSVSLPPMLEGQVALGAGITVATYSVFVIAAGTVVALGTWWALNNTKVGLIVRAGAQDRGMVRHLGIDIDRYYTLVFAFGSALAAVAGIVLAGRQGVFPAMGDSVIIPAFVIVVLGGLGSFRGAVVGGLGVGLIQTMLTSPPVLGEYVPSEELSGVVVFILMIIVLLARPQGLFGNPEWQSSGEEGELLTGSGEGVLGPTWRKRLGIGLVALLALVPLGVGVRYSTYVVDSLLVTMMIWALFALSLDFVLGYAGLVSLGHVLFFGVGAYTSVLVAQGKVAGLFADTPVAALLSVLGYSDSVFLALATGVGVAAVLAWVVGYLSIRVAGVYFAMITLAFAELVRNAVLKLQWAGSTDGLSTADNLDYGIFGQGIGEVGDVVLVEELTIGPVLVIGGEVHLSYYFVLVTVAGSYLLARRMMNAPFGSVLQAIRESEQRAKFLGYDTTAYKRRAFVVSGALAGLAGGLLPITTGIVLSVGPSDLHWIVSGEVIVATILGGMGTLYGPMLGAGLFVGAEELLVEYTDQWQAILGLLFVFFVIFVPRGLVSLPALLDRHLDLDLGGGGGETGADPGPAPEADADREVDD